MDHAVLTVRHTSGFLLWDSPTSEHDVAGSGNPADVVKLYVEECRRQELQPGIYYCLWGGKFNPHPNARARHPGPVARVGHAVWADPVLLDRHGQLEAGRFIYPGDLRLAQERESALRSCSSTNTSRTAPRYATSRPTCLTASCGCRRPPGTTRCGRWAT